MMRRLGTKGFDKLATKACSIWAYSAITMSEISPNF